MFPLICKTLKIKGRRTNNVIWASIQLHDITCIRICYQCFARITLNINVNYSWILLNTLNFPIFLLFNKGQTNKSLIKLNIRMNAFQWVFGKFKTLISVSFILSVFIINWRSVCFTHKIKFKMILWLFNICLSFILG